jgi:hypothetical protein
MRILSTPLLAGLSLAALAATASRAEPGADTDTESLTGRWKLVVLQAADGGLLLLDLKDRGGPISAEIADSAYPPPQRPVLGRVAREGGALRIEMTASGGDASFVSATEEEGRIYGTLRLLDHVLPARLQRTEAESLDPREGQERARAFSDAMQQRDPGARAEKLAVLIDRGDPRADQPIYGPLIAAAAAAGRPAGEVRRYVEDWASGALAYGDAWPDRVRADALRTLTGKRPYAEIALALATEREKALGAGAEREARAEVARALSIAAGLAGKADVAAEARARADRLDRELDADYSRRVPPFRPEAFARKDGRSDRVVLMELFTGAQGPPCAAAEAAFDALILSYEPTELVPIQYHVPVPGPDPLAVSDGLERMRYYQAKGAPSAYFNGRPMALGGGPMPHARAKYDEFRGAIDPMLSGRKRAEIALGASRAGDEIKITASARVPGDSPSGEDGRSAGATPRLRLALIEEQVLYAGASRVRSHHYVVRALPGGPEGLELAGGRGKAEVSVGLGRLRGELERSAGDFARDGRGPIGPPPEIRLEGLAVVAFVQDDDTRDVLHAVLAPVVASK